jgi:hypothetical protein
MTEKNPGKTRDIIREILRKNYVNMKKHKYREKKTISVFFTENSLLVCGKNKNVQLFQQIFEFIFYVITKHGKTRIFYGFPNQGRTKYGKLAKHGKNTENFTDFRRYLLRVTLFSRPETGTAGNFGKLCSSCIDFTRE